MLLANESLEPLAPGVCVIVSPQHTFNTDTILLAWFSSPRHKDRCADLGTGCAAIPLIWHARFAPQHIFAVELQDNAVDMARRSVAENGLQERVSLFQCDIRELAGAVPREMQELDLVACNPPYQAGGSGILNPDPSKQLARHEQACTLEDVCRAGARMLKFGGKFCLCQRPQRLCDVLCAMRAAGIEPKRLRFVQQTPQKPPSLFLVQGKKGANPGLCVEPVLFIEDGDGHFSPEMLAVYGSYKQGHFSKERML